MHKMTPADHRQIREDAGMTQSELAEELGFNRVTVSNREMGKKPIPAAVATLMRYVKAYGPPSRALEGDKK